MKFFYQTKTSGFPGTMVNSIGNISSKTEISQIFEDIVLVAVESTFEASVPKEIWALTLKTKVSFFYDSRVLSSIS